MAMKISARAWMQISVILVSSYSSPQTVLGQAANRPQSSSSDVLETVLDLQQRFINQDNLIDQLTNRVDVLECENIALNQQIEALEALHMGGYEQAAEGADAADGNGDDAGAAAVTARYQCADRCTQNDDCYAFMFDTANNQCRLKIYGPDLNVNEAPSRTQIRYKKRTTTCSHHLLTTPDRSKYVFVEIEGNRLMKTLCVDTLDGAIWAFPHPQAANYMPTLEMDAVMLVYQARGEGSGSHPAQYYAKFRQLPAHRGTPLQLSGTSSRRRIQFVRSVVRGTLNGFTVNNHDESFTNCDSNPSSHIELVTQENIHTQYKFTGSAYGMCQRLVSKDYFTQVNRGSELNYDTFVGMNAFFGGCGGACGTNRNEAEIDGVALGIPAN